MNIEDKTRKIEDDNATISGGVGMDADTARAVGNTFDAIIACLSSGRRLYGKKLSTITSLFNAIDRDGDGLLNDEEVFTSFQRLLRRADSAYDDTGDEVSSVDDVARLVDDEDHAR